MLWILATLDEIIETLMNSHSKENKIAAKVQNIRFATRFATRVCY